MTHHNYDCGLGRTTVVRFTIVNMFRMNTPTTEASTTTHLGHGTRAFKHRLYSTDYALTAHPRYVNKTNICVPFITARSLKTPVLVYQ